jgi:hypothetical protein
MGWFVLSKIVYKNGDEKRCGGEIVVVVICEMVVVIEEHYKKIEWRSTIKKLKNIDCIFCRCIRKISWCFI